MKEVLICTVGGSPEPVIHAVQQNRPHFVYFLCSSGDGPEASQRTIEEETAPRPRTVECPACGKTSPMPSPRTPPIARSAGLDRSCYRIEPIGNPDSLEAVYQACARVEADVAQRFADQAVRVIANYSGGTKTMSLGLGVFATQHRASGWELQVQTAGRKDAIKITSGDMAQPQDMGHILAQDVRRRADELARGHDYEGAIRIIELLLTRTRLAPEERLPLEQTWRSSRMMAAWDRFDYPQALRVVEEDLEALGPHRHQLRKLIRATALYQGDEPWGPKDVPPWLLVRDLMANADRCAQRGRFDDAVGRLYRATELLAQLRLRHRYQIRTGDVPLDHAEILDETRSWLQAERDLRSGKVRIGLFAAYRLLGDLQDELGHFADEHKETLRDLLNVRNSSIFAHGLQPIDGETWGRIGPVWLGWLEQALTRVETSRTAMKESLPGDPG